MIFEYKPTSTIFCPGGASQCFGAWTTIATSDVTMSKLHIGNVVGDAKAEIFSATGREWRTVTHDGSGNAHWQTLAYGAEDYSEVALHDFDADGYVDVFYPGCL